MLIDRISSLVSAVRGVPFRIDPRIPPGYVAVLIASYLVRRLRGWLAFPGRGCTVFIGRGSRLVGRSRMVLEGPLNVGDRCLVNAVSEEGIRFGANVTLQREVVIECTGSLQKLGRGVHLGNHVGIGFGSFLGAAGGIDIGDNTIVGNFVSFHAENHNAERLDVPIRLQGTRSVGIVVGRDCWIGAKATLLDGVRLGHGCIVAAGAVVPAGDYGDLAVLGGVPARLIKRRGPPVASSIAT
jgi:acetyltransferase-like isoleucine patch superfamily enzyme